MRKCHYSVLRTEGYPMRCLVKGVSGGLPDFQMVHKPSESLHGLDGGHKVAIVATKDCNLKKPVRSMAQESNCYSHIHALLVPSTFQTTLRAFSLLPVKSPVVHLKLVHLAEVSMKSGLANSCLLHFILSFVDSLFLLFGEALAGCVAKIPKCVLPAWRSHNRIEVIGAALVAKSKNQVAMNLGELYFSSRIGFFGLVIQI